jgi:hypothetical protein
MTRERAGPLTAAEIGAMALATLAEQTARNRAEGDARRATIRRIMAEHTGPDRLTAVRVREKLSGVPLSVRAIQDHMKIINAESSASRF